MVNIKNSQIKDITLLSVEEAKQLSVSILECDTQWWWLRSPGCDSISAAIVDTDGSVYDYGIRVITDDVAVRPVLKVSNLESLNLKIGDIVECFGMKWNYVGKNKDTGEDQILSVKPIGRHCFNHRANVNIFEKSDIQEYLKSWLRTMKSSFSGFEAIDETATGEVFCTDDKDELISWVTNQFNKFEDAALITVINKETGKRIKLYRTDFD